MPMQMFYTISSNSVHVLIPDLKPEFVLCPDLIWG